MLTAIWLLPIAGALAVALLPRHLTKSVGLGVAGLTLLLTLAVAVSFDPGHRGYQFEENLPWVDQYKVAYHLGVDGISLWLLVLNALLTVIAILATGPRLQRLRGFIAMLLFLAGCLAGIFLAADLLLFYVFWEIQLIPAYFLLWQWGEGRSGRAALKFILYTLVGSLLALVGVIGEYIYAGNTFQLADLAAHPPTPAIQFGLFLLLGLAFAIKVPLFPFHGWLPDAYRAAPAAFLVTFAGVMGKTGAYAMLRILIPLLPHPVFWWDWNGVMPILAVIGIAWGALLALTQRDMKMVIAYSSVSHMGFIVLGIFSFNQPGQQGALIQMINHGVIIPALFLLVAWIGARTGSRDRAVLKDLAPRMPVLAGIFLIVTLAALGLPGLNSFVGEFMTLLGAWQFAPWLAVAGCIGLLLAPVYMLRLFQGVMYAARGEQLSAPSAESAEGVHVSGLPTTADGSIPQPVAAVAARPARLDLGRAELGILLPLVLLMFVLGLYPYLITQAMNALAFPLPVPWR
ncbi:MAG: NADH-quinone oxidoreductase subunit M [Candidatus Dormibacteraeota bacterium]|uniref:NADH-quinone oxidoreductase subunit M n=1 Tax=Candidatus Dormiibacter inghamiae TaxID=3127013 RepID=A0A934KEV3_9BACT|nr:NADH-quinone oxidoreductase subunit M [Candidatus Dormibacteraeota bacterium]MBJ7605306.1 NADH-quinone oxidoreductase subunit M [Candidatus Dormibacteraeota bacterium]